MKFTSLAMCSLRGDISRRDGDANEQGRRFPNAPRDLRSLRRPASGRGPPEDHFCQAVMVSFASQGEGTRAMIFWERTGPPIAPRRTASADLAAERASSVSGSPVLSIEAYGGKMSVQTQYGGDYRT